MHSEMHTGGHIVGLPLVKKGSKFRGRTILGQGAQNLLVWLRGGQ